VFLPRLLVWSLCDTVNLAFLGYLPFVLSTMEVTTVGAYEVLGPAPLRSRTTRVVPTSTVSTTQSTHFHPFVV